MGGELTETEAAHRGRYVLVYTASLAPTGLTVIYSGYG